MSWKPVNINGGSIMRPILNWTWFTLDPTDPTDVGGDADKDGDYECNLGGYVSTFHTRIFKSILA